MGVKMAVIMVVIMWFEYGSNEASGVTFCLLYLTDHSYTNCVLNIFSNELLLYVRFVQCIK